MSKIFQEMQQVNSWKRTMLTTTKSTTAHDLTPGLCGIRTKKDIFLVEIMYDYIMEFQGILSKALNHQLVLVLFIHHSVHYLVIPLSLEQILTKQTHVRSYQAAM